MSDQTTEPGGDGATDIVYSVRAFNRFYMPAMNLLGDHYLGSEYSVTAARIFYEIYANEGCNAAFIARTMRVDKSYLSRLISRYEKNGYIERRPSEKDGRSLRLFLTPKGRRRAEDFVRKSNDDIRTVLGELTPEEEAELRAGLDAVTRVLTREKRR